VSVKEALVGLGPSEREVWVRQNWLKQGQEYFLDLWRGDEGALLWGICNSSSDLDRETSETVQKIRAIRGKNSSWSVWLHLDESEAPGKQLALDGPAGIRKGTTDREGRLNFKNLKPGRYRLRSLIKHYSFDEADSEFELLGGSCPSEYPRGDPNGIKTDANGVVVALGLELVGYRVYAGFYEGRPLWDWQTSPNLYIPPGAEPLDLTLQVRPMMESRR
jgi:hypothetical protein